ncbi:MAG: TRAP transporter small permease subunit [Nitratireductor sp.]
MARTSKKSSSTPFVPTRNTQFARYLSWTTIWVMFAFLINNFLTNIWNFPGANLSGAQGIIQTLLYPAALIIAYWVIHKSSTLSLRADSDRISNMNVFLIRAAFWMVLIIGVVDLAISFLRIENFLEGIVGEDLAGKLGIAQFRGLYVHLPLIGISIVLAFFTKTLGFAWLTLLVVIAELIIVFSRFIFSYEQAFMADLVRFWYGALFLFASAYTLVEEGHVRVDVFYAGFKEKTKGMVNALGTIFFGISLCWTILLVGMANKGSIINGPVFNFEITQQGYGMYVKYLMAAFLGIFAVSMMIQFSSYFLAAIADYRNDPDKRLPESSNAH